MSDVHVSVVDEPACAAGEARAVCPLPSDVRRDIQALHHRRRKRGHAFVKTAASPNRGVFKAPRSSPSRDAQGLPTVFLDKCRKRAQTVDTWLTMRCIPSIAPRDRAMALGWSFTWSCREAKARRLWDEVNSSNSGACAQERVTMRESTAKKLVALIAKSKVGDHWTRFVRDRTGISPVPAGDDFKAKAADFKLWSEIEEHGCYAAAAPPLWSSAAHAQFGREHTVSDESSCYAPLTEQALHRLRMWFPHVPSRFEECYACQSSSLRVACQPGTNNVNITGNILKRLGPPACAISQWLNDDIVGGYFGLISERSQRFQRQHLKMPRVRCLNSAFYSILCRRTRPFRRSGEGSGKDCPEADDDGRPGDEINFSDVQKWTMKADATKLDIIFIPIHGDCHWALVVVYVQSKRIEYLDSLRSSRAEPLKKVLSWCCRYFSECFGKPFDKTDFTTLIRADIPRQCNDDDCGVFMCKYADFIALGHPIDFSQEHMLYFRARMAHELLVSFLA